MAQSIRGDGKHWMEIKALAILIVEWPQAVNIAFIGVVKLGSILNSQHDFFAFYPR